MSAEPIRWAYYPWRRTVVSVLGPRAFRLVRLDLNALKAIASLYAQVQARVLAEDQLRYLAEHDDLTGLHKPGR